MRRKRWVLFVGIGFVTIVGLGWLYSWSQQRRAEAEFQNQLRLARAEGIPTTAAEFAALMKPCSPEENAAPYYRRLAHLRLPYNYDQVLYNLIFSPSAATEQASQEILTANKLKLALIDEAVAKPHCWFDRDWSKGFAVLFPEYADMKSAAKLLVLRASLYAAKGNPEMAFVELEKTEAIENHLKQEPELISSLVAYAVKQIAVRALAEWAYVHPSVSQYRAALQNFVGAWPRADARAEHASDLYSILWLMDSVKTKKGLEELGVRPGDIQDSLGSKVFLKVLSQGKGKADVVKADREMWAAYSLPVGKRDEALYKANIDLWQALFSEPVAAQLLSAFSGGSEEGFWNDLPYTNLECGRLEYAALCRALAGPKIQKKIKIEDLLSPFDGKPLDYRFDGTHVEISVSGFNDEDGKPRRFRFPPDPPKASAFKLPKSPAGPRFN